MMKTLTASLLALALLGALACGSSEDRGKNDFSGAVLHAKKKERITEATGDLRRVADALVSHGLNHGKYPSGISYGALLGELPDLPPNMMTIDPWGEDYLYESDGRSYLLRSSGPDKMMDTDDDIVISR